jgi:chemotaxis protein MotB
MYAISNVNEGKYRVLSHSLETAFGAGQGAGIMPVTSGSGLLSGGFPESGSKMIDLRSIRVFPKFQALADDDDPDQNENHQAEKERLRKLAGEIRRTVAPFIRDDLIEVSRNDDWVEVEMKSSLLFESGSAELSDEAIPVLSKLAATLLRLPNPVHVEGFTDNVPIDTIEFPSNWELSAARSASVVHLFAQQGLTPERMAAIGYGEYHPIADNDTWEGRNENRRVVLLILANNLARHFVPAQAPEEILNSATGPLSDGDNQ